MSLLDVFRHEGGIMNTRLAFSCTQRFIEHPGSIARQLKKLESERISNRCRKLNGIEEVPIQSGPDDGPRRLSLRSPRIIGSCPLPAAWTEWDFAKAQSLQLAQPRSATASSPQISMHDASGRGRRAPYGPWAEWASHGNPLTVSRGLPSWRDFERVTCTPRPQSGRGWFTSTWSRF